jgi:hypothetical protein
MLERIYHFQADVREVTDVPSGESRALGQGYGGNDAIHRLHSPSVFLSQGGDLAEGRSCCRIERNQTVAKEDMFDLVNALAQVSLPTAVWKFFDAKPQLSKNRRAEEKRIQRLDVEPRDDRGVRPRPEAFRKDIGVEEYQSKSGATGGSP